MAKVLVSAVAAITFTTTASAVTAIRAAEDGTTPASLHLPSGCPDAIQDPALGYGVIAEDTHARISWRTTMPTDRNTVTYHTGDAAVQRVDVPSVGRLHTANLTDLTPGTTYAFQVTSTSTDTNESVIGPPCLLTTSGPDHTNPHVRDIRIQDTRATTATLTFVSDEPAVAWANVTRADQPAHVQTYAEDATPAYQTLAHTITLRGLTPGTRYIVRVGARDAAGNTDEHGVTVPFATLRNTSDDAVGPQVTDPQCRIGPTTLTVRFTVAEVPATGYLTYGIVTLDQTREAAPATDAEMMVTNFTRQLTGLAPRTPYRIRAVGVDAAGNATESTEVTCITE
jgi:uncharacterized protein YcnI